MSKFSILLIFMLLLTGCGKTSQTATVSTSEHTTVTTSANTTATQAECTEDLESLLAKNDKTTEIVYWNYEEKITIAKENCSEYVAAVKNLEYEKTEENELLLGQAHADFIIGNAVYELYFNDQQLIVNGHKYRCNNKLIEFFTANLSL